MTLLLMGCGGAVDGIRASIGQPTETTAGVAAGNEVIFWQLDGMQEGTSLDLTLAPYGTVGFTSVDLGATDQANLQAACDGAFGAGNVTVSVANGSATLTLLWSHFGANATPSSDNSTFQPSIQTEGSAAGIAEVQTIPKPIASGGTFTVQGAAEATGPLAYNISVADLQTALNALSDIAAAGGVTVGGSDGGPWVVTWNEAGPQALLTTNGSGLR